MACPLLLPPSLSSPACTLPALQHRFQVQLVHGGPWPATTDARTTSVGTAAIERFLRPVCYQDLPAELLPEALQDANPLKLRRLVDGSWA